MYICTVHVQYNVYVEQHNLYVEQYLILMTGVSPHTVPYRAQRCLPGNFGLGVEVPRGAEGLPRLVDITHECWPHRGKGWAGDCVSASATILIIDHV